jgi:hypothetical protein
MERLDSWITPVVISSTVAELKRLQIMEQDLPDAQPRERDELLDVLEGKEPPAGSDTIE